MPWDIARCAGVEFDVTDLSRSSWDPLGFPVEFFQEIPPAPRLLRRYDLYRGASVMRLDHVNFHHPDPERGRAYYRSLGIVSVS